MDLNGVARRQLFLCFEMLENLIERTPDTIWNEEKGGYVFWQQILHAISGSLFWLRTDTEEFSEPYEDLNVYPELEKKPENQLTKDQITQVLNEAEELAAYYFNRYSSEQLLMESVLVHKISGLDVVFMQIGHLQYHIGHCEAILRDAGMDVPEWLDVI
ncbi:MULTISPECIES: DinB family protein [unclassified Oceanispirochaeta]|uniref:DinB family protein n=1 Tax=unclassified Oceanispirochaeta TaxID=2635722 RepID=UPI000E091EE4|nr:MULTISPECIES: DinB family protein [unclassified Oceanispirochaeta]MBF9017324.1 DinB family protein [Oceanispirochaeta sp. M2]NPD73834.1 DinB family protein [Oceanispirochaeta sp. M1]RDG30434.1 DinB family protein [Oceanispirochaeta sp. M1]